MKQLEAGNGEHKRVMYVISQGGAPAYSTDKLPTEGECEEYGFEVLAQVIVSGPRFTTSKEEYDNYYEQTALKAAGEYVY